MMYTKELATLKEKAEAIETLLIRKEGLQERILEYTERLDEELESTYYRETIHEYSLRVSAIDDLVKLITK